MTLEEVRDRIAELLRWHQSAVVIHGRVSWWRCNKECDESSDVHPVPNTIDGLLALWPMEPFALSAEVVYPSSGSKYMRWNARGGNHDSQSDTPYEAMLRLLLAVLEQQNNHMTTGDAGKEKR